MTLANVLMIGAVAAVVVVLVLGLINMLRGGDPAKAQRLMRLRVGFQLGAVALIGLLAFVGLLGKS